MGNSWFPNSSKISGWLISIKELFRQYLKKVVLLLEPFYMVSFVLSTIHSAHLSCSLRMATWFLSVLDDPRLFSAVDSSLVFYRCVTWGIFSEPVYQLWWSWLYQLLLNNLSYMSCLLQLFHLFILFFTFFYLFTHILILFSLRLVCFCTLYFHMNYSLCGAVLHIQSVFVSCTCSD